jgi:hypothetical protein
VPGSLDPDRIPDVHCLFNALVHSARRRFHEHTGLLGRLRGARHGLEAFERATRALVPETARSPSA